MSTILVMISRGVGSAGSSFAGVTGALARACACISSANDTIPPGVVEYRFPRFKGVAEADDGSPVGSCFIGTAGSKSMASSVPTTAAGDCGAALTRRDGVSAGCGCSSDSTKRTFEVLLFRREADAGWAAEGD
jgi:hypothetical protein